ncbi:hypothetical protein [Micromonospora sp. CB01531]|uniref:hypothetical protein n=1 Tax=Micromonospora sp. CB01531 TaxID=1718947 RepID=UPI001160EA43|nr:hypothetical protein [Micromonospora sp. CB01531]
MSLLARTPKRQCDRAVKRARRELARGGTDLFSSVFWYGAVDIDRKHLVVWVLLAGSPSRLPAWYFPSKDRADYRYDPELLAEIERMRDTVVACFAQEGWPDSERVDVGFDSEARVTDGGGWHYFK